MKVKRRFPTVLLALLLFQIGGIGQTESDIPLVFEYDLRVVNERIYAAHYATFAHGRHAMEYNIACVECHHTLEEGSTAVEETCSDCHEGTERRNYGALRTITPEDERMEYYIIAFHAQCIICHKEIKKHNQNVQVPVACWGCHVRKKK